MKLSQRQQAILTLVKEREPISADEIAANFGLAKSTLRSDLRLLTMTGLLDARPKVGYCATDLKVLPQLSRKMKAYKAKDIMRKAVTISADASLHEAINAMFLNDTGSLYVVDKTTQKLEGLVSRKDLLRGFASNMSVETAVAVVMSRMPNIITITASSSALEAGRLITEHRIDSVPVLSDERPHKVLGKVSKTSMVDLLMALVKEE